MAADGIAAHAAAGGGSPGVTAILASLAVAAPAAAAMVRWWASLRVVAAAAVGSGLLIHVVLHAVTRHHSMAGHVATTTSTGMPGHQHSAMSGLPALGATSPETFPVDLLSPGHTSAATGGGTVMLGAHLLASLSVILTVRLLQSVLAEAATVSTLLRWRPRPPRTIPSTSDTRPRTPMARPTSVLLRHCVVVGAP